MKIYLIRHGETDYNKDKRLQGQCDIELNDYGRELARITAEGLKDIPFDIIYTSPLKRAKETAQIIAGDRNATWFEEPRIQEICFGEYEGKCCGRNNFNVPDKAFLNFFFDTAHYSTPPGGESFEDILKRTGDFLAELTGKREYAQKTVLVSTHGCALKAILANIRHLPIEKFWGEGVHKNCAVTILDADEDKIKILEEGKLFYQ
ncbi:MAG: histidine phosphatase family protein [Suilimivivens sp.]